MRDNVVKLNDNKTELLIITSRDIVSANHVILQSKLVSNLINQVMHLKKRGLIFDTTCNLEHHVSSICKSSNHQLYSSGKILNYLDLLSVKKIVTVTVISRFYFLQLWTVTSQSLITAKMPKQCSLCSISPAKVRPYYISAENHHWLSVKETIQFKILPLTYKCGNSLASRYFAVGILHPWSGIAFNGLGSLLYP